MLSNRPCPHDTGGVSKTEQYPETGFLYRSSTYRISIFVFFVLLFPPWKIAASFTILLIQVGCCFGLFTLLLDMMSHYMCSLFPSGRSGIDEEKGLLLSLILLVDRRTSPRPLRLGCLSSLAGSHCLGSCVSFCSLLNWIGALTLSPSAWRRFRYS